MSSVLVGMFDSQAAAAEAHAKLISAGFSSGAVSMTGGTSATSTPSTSTGTSSTAEPHHEGAIARFFSGIFGDSDDHDSERASHTDTYKEAFKRGSYGVSVTAANDAEISKAEAILNAAGAVDIDEKAEAWKKEGWSGGAVGATAGAAIATGTGATASAKATTPTLQTGGTQKLQEVEEELKVGKRVVAKGGVRVFSRVVEVPVEESVRLREEHAEIQRRAVDRPATEADFAAFKEGSIEVRNSAEEAVVSKTARVVGEVEVGKTATEHEQVISDTLRKTKVEVEQIAPTTDLASKKSPL